MSDARTPSLEEVIEEGARVTVNAMHTTFIARVERYDAATQRCTLTPAVCAFDEAGEVYEPIGVLVSVPWVPLRAGGWVIHLAPQEGDWVTVQCAERSLDEWRLAAAVDQQPADLRRFHLDDAIASFGPWPDGAPLGASVARVGELVLSDEAGTVQLRLRAGEVIVDAPSVKLGGAGASEAVALATKVEAELNKLRDAFNGHTHAVAGVTPGSGSVVAAAPASAPVVEPTGATKVTAL